VIELLNWGHHPAWGYWKHPPLQPWVGDLAVRFAGGRLWGVYLAAQVSVTVCAWAVWRLAREVLPPADALLAVLLLEGVFFYNYNSPKFNHDALQLSLWALVSLAAWQALTRGGARAWVGLGLAAGLGFLSKYSILLLLASLVALTLLMPRARRTLRTPGPWLAVLVALALVTPHLWWLAAHGFPTLTYGLGRAARQGGWLDHVANPLNFAVNHLATVAPLGLLAGLLGLGRRSAARPAPAEPLTRPFLLAVTFGPCVGYLGVSAVTGLHLLSGWGTPLWSFLGVTLLAWRAPATHPGARRRFALALGGLSVTWLALFGGQFVVGPWLGRVRAEHFPGPTVARLVTEGWRARFPGPLPVVAGDRGFADPVGFYAPDRPDVYDLVDSAPVKNLGLDDASVRRRGGVLVWNARTEGPSVPSAWRTRFPRATAEPVATVPWLTGAPVTPTLLGWAVLAPAGP
jgi:4-amino-4-deoxy-L-arabinose transferase-like glycosyltransferase